jgi:hypothetical protein
MDGEVQQQIMRQEGYSLLDVTLLNLVITTKVQTEKPASSIQLEEA